MQYSIEIPIKFYTQEIHDFMKPFYETGKLSTYPQPKDYERDTIIKEFIIECKYKGEIVPTLEILFDDFERQYGKVNEFFTKLPDISCILYEGDFEGMPALKHFIYPNAKTRTVQINLDEVEVIDADDIEQIIRAGGDMTDIYKLLIEKSSYESQPIHYYASSFYTPEREKTTAAIQQILREVDEGKISNADAMDKIREIRKGGE